MKNTKNYRYLNFVANILIVLIGAMLLGSFAYGVFYQPSLGSIEAELLKSGEKFKGLQEIDFSKSPNTILLATNIECQYGTQSLPFYKKIIAKSKENSAVRVIAVFKNKKEDVENYLREHDINIEFVPNVDLVNLKIDATPTVIWVDTNRKIVGSYQGLLRENHETAFFEVYEKRLVNR